METKGVEKSLPVVGVLEKGSLVGTQTVKWWHSKLSPEVVRADAEGAALSILDCLVKDEDFRDCLDQGLKCETDRWEGHVTWLGPKAVEHILKPYSRTIPIFLHL